MKLSLHIIGMFAVSVLFLFTPVFLPSVSAAIPEKIDCPQFIPGCQDGAIDIDFGEYQDSELLTDIIPNLLSWGMRITAAVAILMGVVSGVMFLYAGVDEELKTRATKTFLYSGLGLIIMMFAYFIVAIVNKFPFSGN